MIIGFTLFPYAKRGIKTILSYAIPVNLT